MDSRYVPIYKQAAAMQHQFHDYSHHFANNPQAVVLRNEIHNLTNDLAANRHPRTIEHRLKTIQNEIRMSQTHHPGLATGSFNAPILNPHESNMLHHNFEQMRRSIHMNPHF